MRYERLRNPQYSRFLTSPPFSAISWVKPSARPSTCAPEMSWRAIKTFSYRGMPRLARSSIGRCPGAEPVPRPHRRHYIEIAAGYKKGKGRAILDTGCGIAMNPVARFDRAGDDRGLGTRSR